LVHRRRDRRPRARLVDLPLHGLAQTRARREPGGSAGADSGRRRTGGTDGAGPIRSPLRRAAVTGRIFKDLLALRAPALDGAVDALFLAAGGIPQRDEARVFRSRPLGFLERVERDADRDRHAFAADDALTVPERRDR